MAFSTLSLDHPAPGVARICLNRPDAFNALGLPTAIELREALRNVEMDAAVRALVLTGSGRAFCAGGDVHAFYEALPAPQQLLKDIVLPLHDAVAIITHMDKPVIAAVNGAAAGAGMGLLLAADLALGASSAKLSLAYTALGASPDGSTSFYLPRVIGLRRALELVLENRVLGAEEAAQWGLLNRVVPDAELEREAQALAERLASGPTRAFALAKRLLHTSFDSSFESQLMREGRGIAALGGTEDFAEGVTAFVQKRSPVFKGR